MPIIIPCSHDEDDIPEPGTIILLTVPDVRQSTRYSCGASSLQAVLNYWGIDVSESDLMELLHTSPHIGTDPEAIVSVASSFGLSASLSENLSIGDLKKSIELTIPVIIRAQAWSGHEENGHWISDTPDNWEDTWKEGHYMVVIGVDSRNVYLEDPLLLGTRGIIPIDEFLSRWHDYQRKPNPEVQKIVYNRLGIFISGDKPAIYPTYTRIS